MKIVRGISDGLIHVRKTVTFTGAAGAGAVGTVAVFTVTGRVIVPYNTVFCTTSLEEAAPTATIIMGVASDTDAFRSTSNAVDCDQNDWLLTAASNAGVGVIGSVLDADYPIALSESIAFTIGAQNVTAGVLVCDIWYYPITDDGALVAA